MHPLLVGMDQAVEPDMPELALVIDFFAQPGRDLGLHLARVDRPVVAPIDREHDAELAKVGLHGGRHVRILQLAGEIAAVLPDRAMHLAERRGRGGLALEAGEPLFPIGAELGHHPAPDEQPAHRRGVGLQLAQLLRIFPGQDVGDGRHDLGDLHQGALEAAKRPPDLLGVALPVHRHAEIALARETGGDAAHRGADAAIPPDPSGQPVVLATPVRRPPHSASSSSSISASISASPCVQNAGSEASSPNGASSSRWRSVPPASSIRRYFSAKPSSPLSCTA